MGVRRGMGGLMAGRNVVCFGELLLRLNAPGHELLLQSPDLRVYVGGAEANVAAAIAQFGHAASVVSILPDNALGAACVGELRRLGVNTEYVRTAPGRLGLYFMATGAGHRPSEIIYDRADSSFERHVGDGFDWTQILAGAAWLHVSGITPALGASCAEATLRAVRMARTLGVSVSFDSNYRAKLWESWSEDPARALAEIAAQADLLFADDRAISLMLNLNLPDLPPLERFSQACEQAFTRFAHLQKVATAVRVEHSVDRHDISAVLMTRERLTVSRTYALESIVDRIGTGDAFAAGMLHGALSALDDSATLDFALAAEVLKHATPGDMSRASLAEIRELLAGTGFSVRR